MKRGYSDIKTNNFNTKCINSIDSIKEEVSISPFDDFDSSTYLISYHNRHWKVKQLVYYIFLTIDGKRNIYDIKKRLHEKYNISLQSDKIEEIVDNFFRDNGLLAGSYSKKAAKKNSLLWGRLTLISPKTMLFFKPLTFLYHPKLMSVLSGVIIIYLIYVFSTYPNNNVFVEMLSLNYKHFFLTAMMLLLLSITHEIGHAVALMKYGITPGRIGVGIYYIIPVLFVDLANIWKLKRTQRFIVDLGGVYFQGIALIICLFLNAYFINSSYFLIAMMISSLQFILHFNPFIKFDGYWMTVDLLVYQLKNLLLLHDL